MTDELRVLRLLCTVSCPISLPTVEFISGIKISSLTKMQKDGLILMDNQSIKITNKGREENEKTLDKGPEA